MYSGSIGRSESVLKRGLRSGCAATAASYFARQSSFRAVGPGFAGADRAPLKGVTLPPANAR